jgi:hypothetical protein
MYDASYNSNRSGCDEASKAWEEGKNRLVHPSNIDELGMTPEWAAPIVERALQLHPPAWLEPDATRSPSL